ncbi:ATP-dependent Clp protease proteolytic subunit [Carbonactinospora thermoautotrophica]|uniref:ClpP family protease n=1 Tax=Carbonactinospora thermoautotrophica TaxID=1469144 RepID=UPI00226DABD9|nr:ATP-dependent Clp protease proteolytic subunit [Carbonactinospora thermoautotrophica]MCX9193419.1 ATP-dependent Clp protease proteolytic subunit [Carbonactinospora thermoautotrophica]
MDLPGPRPGEGVWPAWLYERLLEQRLVLVQGRLDRELATRLCAQLLTLDATGDAPVRLHLASPDGELAAALTVIDVFDLLTVPVHAVATGQVGGPSVGVLAAAHDRRAYPHATFRLSEPRGRFEGSAAELATQNEQHRWLLDDFYARLAQDIRRPVARVRHDTRQGRFLTAGQAVTYGLIDAIVEQRTG